MSTVSAVAATPQPNDAANAIAAKPSSADFSRSWSAPWPMPSVIEPRMVSGPVQKMMDAVTNPSMKRARPPDPSFGVSRRCSQPPSPSSRSSSRSSEPTMPPTSSAPSTIRSGALSPTASAQASFPIAAADVAAISSVTSPSPSVTTVRVRSGSR